MTKNTICVAASDTCTSTPVKRVINDVLVSSIAVISQMLTCVRPTEPTPITLPAIISSGRIVASSTSNTRDVFSSMIDRATFIPYSMITKYIRKNST